MEYPRRVPRLVPLLLILGCAGVQPSATEPSPESMPDASFAALEQTLFETESFVLPFSIQAEGAIAASLEGELRIEGPLVRLTATGDFAGEAVDLQLRADERSLFIGEEERERPPHLKEALILGLTRMGILHNLAVLTSGGAPDHSDEGVEPWLRVAVTEADPYAFTILVDGETMAEGRLAVEDERLLWRTQTVSFPEGEMHVRERYEAR